MLDQIKRQADEYLSAHFFVTLLLSSIVVFAIFILFAAIRFSTSASAYSIKAFATKQQCQSTSNATDRYKCEKAIAMAGEVDKTINWAFTDKASCENEYGACAENSIGRWGPIKVGFAFLSDYETVRSLPVYLSTKSGILQSASAVPISLGESVIHAPLNDPEMLVGTLNIHKSIKSSICVATSDGEKICKSREALQKEINEAAMHGKDICGSALSRLFGDNAPCIMLLQGFASTR